MGLKEMLDKQRAQQAQMKGGGQPAGRTIPEPANAPQVASPNPAPAAGNLSLMDRFKKSQTKPIQTIGSKPSSSDVLVQPSPSVTTPAKIAEKKDEKITTPSPGPAAQIQGPERGKSENLVGNGAANSNSNNSGGNPAGNSTNILSANLTQQPSDPPAGLEELRKNIAFLSANIDQKELVGQVVRRVLIDLKKNPQFSTHLTDVDFNTITRAFRRSAVVAARKKTEARETKAKKKAGDNEFADFMANSGMKNFDLGGGGSGNGWS